MKTKHYLGIVIILTMLLVLVSASSVSAAAEKTDVCHLDKEMGTFKLISISDNAYETHLAHGDVNPGDAIPGMLGMAYGADCSPMRVFADVNGTWIGQSGLRGSLGYAFTMTLTQTGTTVLGTIYYPSINTTRTVTGSVSGFTMTITTADVTYTATVSGTITGTYFYGEGTGTPVTQLVALEATKQ
ncbi:MAG: hypothetical protein ABFD51_04125 [Anaerolineaceae bacterium]